MDAPVEEALAAEETAAPAAQEAAAPQTAAARIATNVGVVPAGIDWADNVTANTFAEPYATVTAKDKAGNEYTVEVIPADTVYFIDSVAATGNDKMDNVQSTAAYAAAKALLGDQLLTDCLSARRLGVPCIIVPPIRDKKTLFFRCKRALEKPFLAAYRRAHKGENRD